MNANAVHGGVGRKNNQNLLGTLVYSATVTKSSENLSQWKKIQVDSAFKMITVHVHTLPGTLFWLQTNAMGD